MAGQKSAFVSACGIDLREQARGSTRRRRCYDLAGAPGRLRQGPALKFLARDGQARAEASAGLPAVDQGARPAAWRTC